MTCVISLIEYLSMAAPPRPAGRCRRPGFFFLRVKAEEIRERAQPSHRLAGSAGASLTVRVPTSSAPARKHPVSTTGQRIKTIFGMLHDLVQRLHWGIPRRPLFLAPAWRERMQSFTQRSIQGREHGMS